MLAQAQICVGLFISTTELSPNPLLTSHRDKDKKREIQKMTDWIWGMLTAVIEERDTQWIIRYEDDAISEYVRAVWKLLSDLMHLALSTPKCASIIS